MPNEQEKAWTRRDALAFTLGGAAAAAAGVAMTGASLTTPKESAMSVSQKSRMPVVYIPHGGGPWPFVDLGLDRDEVESLKQYLASVRSLPPVKPRAVLMISAHWEEPVLSLQSSARPPMYYDYYGFPPESYTLQWPAPGAPDVAGEVQAVLEKAGWSTVLDGQRGYDHGTFIPMMLTYPQAEVPTLQLSLRRGLDPAEHLEIGRALAPLREQGIFIIGSGMSFHNLSILRDPRARPVAATFDRWLQETVTATPVERNKRLIAWSEAPAARLSHPREEHLLPLMVVAGAALEETGKIGYNGKIFGLVTTGVHFG